jgi:hypothetical protein
MQLCTARCERGADETYLGVAYSPFVPHADESKDEEPKNLGSLSLF